MTEAQSVMPFPERPGRWFTWDEFACKDVVGTIYPLDIRATRGLRLGRELDRIRDHTGPLHLSSVYRDWKHHCAIYAAMRPPQAAPVESDHLHGNGADVTCPSTMKWAVFVPAVLEVAHADDSLIRYLRFYRSQRFVHVGTRDRTTLLVEYA
jgi:hypothetical protein